MAQPNREQRQSRHGELFSSARESSRQQMESSWGRASAWENDGDLGASLAWVTAQDTQNLLLLLQQPSEQQFWQGQPSQGSLVRPLSLIASALLSPCSPQQPCFSCLLFETIPGPFILWPPCESLGTSAYLPIPPFFNFLCRVRSLYLLYQKLHI